MATKQVNPKPGPHKDPNKHGPHAAMPVWMQYLKKCGFELGPVIGDGSYSTVRKAVNNKKDFALKIVHLQDVSEEVRDKFLPRERRNILMIEHKHIIKVHNIIEYAGTVTFVMELAEKGDLHRILYEKGPLDEATAKKYFKQLVSAIKYLHDREMCHRDIKCENILISADDSVKLGDFGFSRMCIDDEGKRILSRTFCGSASYASPEILKGLAYNPKMADVWSLGCVLFMMLTRRHAFSGSSVREIMEKQKERKVRFSEGNPSKISRECKMLVRQILEPDLLKRIVLDRIIHSRWLRSN